MRDRKLVRAALAVAATCIAACTTPQDPPDEPGAISIVDIRDFSSRMWTQTDVVVVVDNSPAMAPYAAQLPAVWSAMTGALEHTWFEASPEYRLGVVTTDPADGGVLRLGRFLGNTAGFGWHDEHDFPGALADSFASLAYAGTSGGAAHPIEALERALQPDVNPGFVRDDAYLAMIIVAATDDPGTEPVAAIRARLATKPDPSRVAIGLAVPCGLPTPRLDALLAQFPNRATRVELCGDVAPLGAMLTEYLRAALGGLCFPRSRGAFLVELRDDAGETLTIPPCPSAGASRCYTITPDDRTRNGCTSDAPDGLELHPPATPFAASFHVECEVLAF